MNTESSTFSKILSFQPLNQQNEDDSNTKLGYDVHDEYTKSDDENFEKKKFQQIEEVDEWSVLIKNNENRRKCKLFEGMEDYNSPEKRVEGSYSNPPELIGEILSKKMLEKKINPGLLNDIESNKQQEIVRDASYEKEVNNIYNSPEKQINFVNKENTSRPNEKKVMKRKSTMMIAISKAEQRIELENFQEEIQLILKQQVDETNLSKVKKTKRRRRRMKMDKGSNSNPPELVITIEDSSDEDSSDEYITADEAETIKLLCHKCGKEINALGSAFEGFVHQFEEHHDEFKTNMSKDFDGFHLATVIVDDNTDYYDRNLFGDNEYNMFKDCISEKQKDNLDHLNQKDIGLYIDTAESEELEQWEKLGIYKFSDRKYFKKYLHSITSIFINLKSNFEIVPKIIKLPQNTLVDIENVFKIALLEKEIERIDDSYNCNLCIKSFKNENSVKNHWKMYHICSFCTKVFPKNTLQDHVKKVHRGSKKTQKIKNISSNRRNL